MKYDIKKIEQMYSDQFQLVDNLVRMDSISASDLVELNRIGKYRLIDIAWGLLTQDARIALLNDEHHFVRASAQLAMPSRALHPA